MKISHEIRVFVAMFFQKYPEMLFKLNYWRVMKKRLNLKKPQTLYEHIAYMEFYTDTSQWSVLSDKIAVRDYICSKGYEDTLTKLYGIWEEPKQIDYGKLPSSFVIKTNHACATNIIVKDKSLLDKGKANLQLAKWLKYEYGKLTAQPHYTKIKPKIFAEEYLQEHGDSNVDLCPTDYKFYCINGEPLFVQVLNGRRVNTHQFNVMLYDMSWKPHVEYLLPNHHFEERKIPTSFERMKKMSRELSQGFYFVRIDLYEINEKIYFGEMSFTPGLGSFNQKFYQDLGNLLK